MQETANKADKAAQGGRLRRFLSQGLWQDLSSITGIKGLIIRVLRVLQLVAKGCRDENLAMHASALTYSTLMSIVPLLAITLSMSKGLGAGKQLEQNIQERVDIMPEQFQAFVNDILVQVNTANFYAIGGIGGVVLIFMVVQVLSSMEASFNRIWGIKKSRNMLRRVANYISTLVVVPVLMLASGTVTAFFEPLMAKLGAGAFYELIIRLSPLLGTWLALSLLYFLIPNTRVRPGAALIGGMFAAICWVSWLRMFVTVQPGVSNYNVIYGTLASIPIFLLWLFVSWIIVLLGSLFGFAFQNYETYALEKAAPRASMRSRAMLALGLVARTAEGMEQGKGALDAEMFAREKGISIRLIHQMLGRLVDTGLLAEVGDKEGAYVLMKSPDRIKVKEVLEIIHNDGSDPVDLGLQNLSPVIHEVVKSMDAGLEASLKDRTIRDLLAV